MTAVEYLVGYITSDGGFDLQAVIKQAKEMEKQQIKLSYKDGRNDQQSPKNSVWFNRSSEQYYNENFKSE